MTYQHLAARGHRIPVSGTRMGFHVHTYVQTPARQGSAAQIDKGKPAPARLGHGAVGAEPKVEGHTAHP